jgi:hypothetical protein
MKSNFALITLLAVAGTPAAAQTPASEPYALSYAAGGYDDGGNFLGGTEFMNLTTFNGKLYGGLSYFMDDPGTDPKSGAQIIVLDSSTSQWQQEFVFDQTDSVGNFLYGRINSLQVVQFQSYDPTTGTVEGTLANILTTSFSGNGGVWTQESPGNWVNTELPTSQEVRSMATHYVAGQTTNTLFAGASGFHIYAGTYDPSVPGQITWDKKPEILVPEVKAARSRVMSMTECGGYLFAAVNPSIYRRNDQTKSWEVIYTYPADAYDLSKDVSGFRALNCVILDNGQSALMTGLEGDHSSIFSFDPQTGVGSIVLNVNGFLTQQWGNPSLNLDTIAGYDDNDIALVNGDQLTGLDTRSPVAGEKNAAFFISCIQDQCDLVQSAYQLHEVPVLLPWPYYRSNVALESIRTVTVSPFPEDQGQVIYLGGYDGGHVAHHNTAWLYRVGINTALAH